jgi:hypothetical protein
MKKFLTLCMILALSINLQAKDMKSTEEIINSILKDDARLTQPKDENKDNNKKSAADEKSEPKKEKDKDAATRKEKGKSSNTTDEILYKTAIELFNVEQFEAAKKDSVN